MKKIVSAIAVFSLTTGSMFAGNDMPPMPPSFGTKAPKTYPTSCNSLPQMIVFLPPPMEVDFIQCKNDLNMPSVLDTTKALITKFGKTITGVKVTLAEGFHQLYKVDFKLGETQKTILVNSELSKFINAPEFVEFKSTPAPTLLPSTLPTVPVAESDKK